MLRLIRRLFRWVIVMDKIEKESLIKKIESVQKEFPNIVLPSMGIVNNEKKIEIDGKDYIKHKSVGEE